MHPPRSQGSQNKELYECLCPSAARLKGLLRKSDSLEVQEKVNLDKKVLSLFWAVQGGGSGANVLFGCPASDMGNSGLRVVVKAREESEKAPCPTRLY